MASQISKLKPIVEDYITLCKDKDNNNRDFDKYYSKKSIFLQLKNEDIDKYLNNNKEDQIQIKKNKEDVILKLTEKEKEMKLFMKINKFKRMVNIYI
jgi:formylmethanofuran dehydrogenase subunit D